MDSYFYLFSQESNLRCPETQLVYVAKLVFTACYIKPKVPKNYYCKFKRLQLYALLMLVIVVTFVRFKCEALLFVMFIKDSLVLLVLIFDLITSVSPNFNINPTCFPDRLNLLLFTVLCFMNFSFLTN